MVPPLTGSDLAVRMVWTVTFCIRRRKVGPALAVPWQVLMCREFHVTATLSSVTTLQESSWQRPLRTLRQRDLLSD